MTLASNQQLRAALADVCCDDLDVRADEPMSRHTTLRVGGGADMFVRPRTMHALAALLSRCHACSIPVTFLGGGSNLIVRDAGIRGVTIQLTYLNTVKRPDPAAARVVVEAGASTGKLLQHSISWALGGVEFLAGVPGSVGGGLVMNAGTYLGEFTNVVSEVHSLRGDGTLVVRDHAACGFRYRASDIPPDEIVVSAVLRLHARDRAAIEADVAALRRRRSAREPHGVPNSGSTFKNPPGDYAGRLIEAAGLKGTRFGTAVVSPVHANWLVFERGSATSADDLLALIELVRVRVQDVHGISLELEVKIVGDPCNLTNGQPLLECANGCG